MGQLCAVCVAIVAVHRQVLGVVGRQWRCFLPTSGLLSPTVSRLLSRPAYCECCLGGPRAQWRVGGAWAVGAWCTNSRHAASRATFSTHTRLAFASMSRWSHSSLPPPHLRCRVACAI
eukprot:7287890-Alexandrium_andersonii.AAC.1